MILSRRRLKTSSECKASWYSQVNLASQQRYVVLLGILCLAASGCSDPQSPTLQSYPEAGSAAAILFISRCGECHAAPQPTSHDAKIWPGVVQRMQMRRRAMSKTPLNQQELATILDYLQRHAATKSINPEIQ